MSLYTDIFLQRHPFANMPVYGNDNAKLLMINHRTLVMNVEQINGR